jgi:hypothetical protein
MTEKQHARAIRSDWAGFIWRIIGIAFIILGLAYAYKACNHPPPPQQKGPYVMNNFNYSDDR